MLRKLLATGIVFAAGYILGVIFGFRSAVVDYVENDAESIESLAEKIYPSPREGADTGEVPDEVGAVLSEALEKEDEENGDKGFQ